MYQSEATLLCLDDCGEVTGLHSSSAIWRGRLRKMVDDGSDKLAEAQRAVAEAAVNSSMTVDWAFQACAERA